MVNGCTCNTGQSDINFSIERVNAYDVSQLVYAEKVIHYIIQVCHGTITQRYLNPYSYTVKSPAAFYTTCS